MEIASSRPPGPRIPGVPYLRVANVMRGYLDLDEIKTMKVTSTAMERTRLN